MTDPDAATPPAPNLDIAERFREVADLLEDEQQAQWTVVTEPSGSLAGNRVVRGREAECQRYYEAETEAER